MNRVRQAFMSVLGVASIATLTIACGGNPDGENQQDSAELLKTRWVVQSVTVDGEKHKAPKVDGPYIIFDADTAEGSTGCNGFSAEISIDGNTITVSKMTKTNAACLPGGKLEKKFLQVFSESVEYAISDEKKLTFTHDENTATLMLE